MVELYSQSTIRMGGFFFILLLIFLVDGKVVLAQDAGGAGLWEKGRDAEQIRWLVITFGIVVGLTLLTILFFKKRKKKTTSL